MDYRRDRRHHQPADRNRHVAAGPCPRGIADAVAARGRRRCPCRALKSQRVQAYFDGEVDAADAPPISSGTCRPAPSARRRWRSSAGAQRAARRVAPARGRPPQLRARISAALDRGDRGELRRVPPRRGPLAIAAVLVRRAQRCGRRAVAAALAFLLLVPLLQRSAAGRAGGRSHPFADAIAPDRCGVDRPAHRQALVRRAHGCLAGGGRFRRAGLSAARRSCR